MDTLKTAVVVLLMLAVVYGVYVVLNQPAAPVPQEIAWYEQKAAEPLQVEMSGAQPLEMSPSGRQAGGSTHLPDKLPSLPALPSGGENATTSSNPPPLAHLSGSNIRAELSPETSPSALPENLPSKSIGAPREPEPSTVAQHPGAAPSLLSSPPPGSSPGSSRPPELKGTEPTAVETTAPVAGPREQPKLEPSGDQPRSDDAVASLPNSSSYATAPPAATSTVGKTTPSPTNADTYVASQKSDGAMPLPDLTGLGRSVGNVLRSAASTADALEAAKNDIALSTKGLYDAALREARTMMEAGHWYQALFVLSKFYQSTDLTAEQHTQLVNLLDPLAAKVVYSTESINEPPHEVVRGDTLDLIAEKYQVPPELIGNINGISKSDLLLPGTRLKVVRGPFRAVVDLNRSELTLFSGQLYAGRFPVHQGSDPAPKAGEYRVQEKQPGRVYYAGDGRTIPVDDPTNPYGQAWIGLGSDVCIHGSPDQGDSPGLGCISLSPHDAQDVYGILSVGSSVTIR